MATLKVKSEYLTFTDGWATSWVVRDRKLLRERQQVIHFREATVGERRFWDAQVAGVQIVRAVYVPELAQVMEGDVLIINGIQYEVAQKDRKDTKPVSWLLSLKKAVVKYAE